MLDDRLESQQITWEEAQRLRFWMEKGYVILEGAVDPRLCDRINADIREAWQRSDHRVLAQHPDLTIFQLDHSVSMELVRTLDVYTLQRAARDALLSPAIQGFLRLIFEAPPLLFQSLSFHTGSEQGIHQDTAYVVTTDPMRLAASWIALEDVAEGCGELQYYEGSHRLPEFHFSGDHKHWNPETDGKEQHDRWSTLLHENARERGMPLRRFRPRKGDVLIWSADLAHGGSPIEDRSLTRRSLVGHYTPVSADPHYFSYRPERRTRLPWNGAEYASSHYDIAGMPAPEVARSRREFLRRILSRVRR
jgi:ectoine hydroxylase-related dioxygenase (phytanoyl-CoA dioxygenase family)